MARSTRWSLPREFRLVVFLLLSHCQADDLKQRNLFGISVQAVPEQPQQEDRGPVVEAPTQTPTRSNSGGLPSLPTASPATARPTIAPLPGYGINDQGLEGVKRQKKNYDAAQWLLLLQFLFVFWLIIFVVVAFIFLLEKYGIFRRCGEHGENAWGKQGVYCGLSKACVFASSIVILLGLLFTIFSVYEGYYTTPPAWFKTAEKAEASFMKNLPFQIPGLSPTPAPTVAPAVAARAKAEKEARDAQVEYQAVKNQLEQLKVQLKQQQQATEQQKQAYERQKQAAEQKAAELAKEQAKNQALSRTPPPTAPPTAPPPPPTFAPKQMNSLAAKVAALKKKAEAKAAEAKAATLAPAPVTAAPAPAAPLPPGASPCTTLAPKLAAAPAPPMPQITMFVPPGACTCKAVGVWKPHCAEYPIPPWDKTPACVVTDKACSPETNAPNAPDPATGNPADKIVKCVPAPPGGSTPYSVNLDTSMSNSGLGMKILPDKQMTDLIVTSVEGGVVALHNQAHPGSAVKVGDMITAVNGKMGNSVALLKESMKKEKLSFSMMHQVGYPIAQEANAAPAVPKGKCRADVHPWGKNSVCLSAQKGAPGSYTWHCPWESMMAVSTKTWGGCVAVKYDCNGMDYHAVLDLYKNHDTMATPPPEGSLATVEYVACCIRHQCMAQPLDVCGEAPWIPGKSVSPFVGKANPCGAAGCERLYSTKEVLSVSRSRPVIAVAGLCLLLVTAAVLAIARSRGLRGDHQVLLEMDAEAAHTNEAFVNLE